MNPPVAITMPGTLNTNLPHPPAMSGVTPISVIDSPMAMASTAMDRMIHFRLAAGSGTLAEDVLTGAFVTAFVPGVLGACVLVSADLPDLAGDVPARGAADAPGPLGG